MGASKRLAGGFTSVIYHANRILRNGAVWQCAGLVGSVVPYFVNRSNLGPVTVTHEDVTRIADNFRGSRLVIQAGAMTTTQPKWTSCAGLSFGYG